MPEIKDGQYNINLKWFEFDQDDENIWINFEKVIWIKHAPGGNQIQMAFSGDSSPSTQTITFSTGPFPNLADIAAAKMRHILKVINVDKLSPQGS